MLDPVLMYYILICNIEHNTIIMNLEAEYILGVIDDFCVINIDVEK